jgi:hypothetical protein
MRVQVLGMNIVKSMKVFSTAIVLRFSSQRSRIAVAAHAHHSRNKLTLKRIGKRCHVMLLSTETVVGTTDHANYSEYSITLGKRKIYNR